MNPKIFSRLLLIVLLAAVGLSAAACSPNPGRAVEPTSDRSAKDGPANMANPASVFCGEHGGTLVMRDDGSGGQIGMCIFSDNTSCEEWAYFRGECQPGQPAASPTTAPENPWTVYQNDRLPFTFEYPSDAAITSTNDDPTQNITITGPLVDNEHWPVIFIDYPTGRDDFRPPEDAGLVQWLTEHNLIFPELRQPDRTIAGTLAVHLRDAAGPQSFADDRYFFAHAGQLYSITIVHTGNKEDWDLYNHILDSFAFPQK